MFSFFKTLVFEGDCSQFFFSSRIWFEYEHFSALKNSAVLSVLSVDHSETDHMGDECYYPGDRI